MSKEGEVTPKNVRGHEDKGTSSERELNFDKKELDFDEKHQKCKQCLCDVLSNLVDQQNEHHRNCSLQALKNAPLRTSIPFILQTPYGHPFFTWGEVGEEDCFATVFFKVVKVDCKENCAVLQLLKPNVSLIDADADVVEPALICNVDYVTETKERVLVDLSCYSAIKLISPDFVKSDTDKNALPH